MENKVIKKPRPQRVKLVDRTDDNRRALIRDVRRAMINAGWSRESVDQRITEAQAQGTDYRAVRSYFGRFIEFTEAEPEKPAKRKRGRPRKS